MLIDDKTNSSDKPIRIVVRLSLEFDTKNLIYNKNCNGGLLIGILLCSNCSESINYELINVY